MKIISTLFLSFSFLWAYCQELTVPQGYSVLAETSGDLDKDSIAERVLVYNTPDSSEYGYVRELQVLKLKGNKWVLWQKSREAILSSEEGGMMGDPFGEIEIKNGVLLVSFFGGSSWKWAYTDKYRFEKGEFRLIGYESYSGKFCEHWDSFDFNLVTGKIVYKKACDGCEENGVEVCKEDETETFFKKKIYITMNTRKDKQIKIVSPKYKRELYL